MILKGDLLCLTLASMTTALQGPRPRGSSVMNHLCCRYGNTHQNTFVHAKIHTCACKYKKTHIVRVFTQVCVKCVGDIQTRTRPRSPLMSDQLSETLIQLSQKWEFYSAEQDHTSTVRAVNTCATFVNFIVVVEGS